MVGCALVACAAVAFPYEKKLVLNENGAE